MKCEKYKFLLIEKIYNEISPENAGQLKKHLQRCETCRQEYERLKATTEALRQWEDVEPEVNLTFIKDTVTGFSHFWEKIKNINLLPKLAWGFGILLVLLSLAGFSVRIEDGDFRLSLGIFNRTPKIPAEQLITQAEFEQRQKKNVAMIAQMLDEYARKDQVKTAVMINDVYQELEAKRKQDLQLLTTSLQQVHYNSAQQFDQTERQLQSLIRYVSYQDQLK